MHSVDDWPDGARPKDWREMILWLYPNGRAALTAIMSKGRKERANDYEYNWWTQSFPEQRGAFTAGEIYTNVALSSAYAGSGTAGQVLYVKTTEAVASEFRYGHQVLLRDTDDLSVDVQAKCVGVHKNGSSSYVACKLLEADDNSDSNDLQTADVIKVCGNINPQGGVTPPSITYFPTKFYNKTQIFRTSLEIARTVMRTRSRTGNTYENMKTLALELHGVEMEWAWLFGIVSENVGDNNMPETTTEGIITFLRNNLSAHVRNYALLDAYSGQTWLEGGDDFLIDSFELLTRYGDPKGNGDWISFIGSGFLKNISRLARQSGEFVLNPGASIGYGIKVNELVNEFGTWPLYTHPLFNQEATMRNSALFFKPRNLVYKYIDDTDFYPSAKGKYGYTSSGKRIDGLNEEWLTEAGMEYHHPQTAMFLYGAGDTNTA